MDLLTVGEALVEIMRTDIDQPLDQPGPFTGPYPSGAPFIFAVQAARLGADVGAVGHVGADAFGRCLLNQLEVDGVQTSGVQISSAGATGAAFIAYRADGSREFVFNLGVAAQLSPAMLTDDLFAGLRCLHLMGSTLSMSPQTLQTGLAALAKAQAAGALISFDPNLRPEMLPPDEAREAFAPLLSAADVLLPTEEELLLLTGERSVESAVRALHAQKPQRIIVMTQGAGGCTVYTAEDAIHAPGYPVQEVDPTGAGDCFDAGFLMGWLRGDALDAAARQANACGALAVTKQGPMAGAQPLQAVQQFMAQHAG